MHVIGIWYLHVSRPQYMHLFKLCSFHASATLTVDVCTRRAVHACFEEQILGFGLIAIKVSASLWGQGYQGKSFLVFRLRALARHSGQQGYDVVHLSHDPQRAGIPVSSTRQFRLPLMWLAISWMTSVHRQAHVLEVWFFWERDCMYAAPLA